MLTDEQLTEMERLAGAASPGPWSHRLELDPPDPGIDASPGGCVAHVQCHGNVNTIVRTGEEFSHADARFIAATRDAVPALVAEVRRLREEIAGLKSIAAKPIDLPKDYFVPMCSLPGDVHDFGTVSNYSKEWAAQQRAAAQAVPPFEPAHAVTLYDDGFVKPPAVAEADELSIVEQMRSAGDRRDWDECERLEALRGKRS